MQDLSRHMAVVTGASSGIGEAIARNFAAAGARLVLAARRADRLEQLARELDPAGTRIRDRPTDVSDEADVIGLFADAEAFGPVTLLVSNAGIVNHCPTADLALADWQNVIDVNLTAAFVCAREALRVMQPRRRGRIINIGSISAHVPREHSIAYTATKFALEGMTHALALDGRAHGITASIIHPGSTISEFAGAHLAQGTPSEKTMAAANVAELVAIAAAVPDEVNVLNATILPIAQPFLGRG